jgi:two-component system OmpR family response regulator
VRALLRRGQAPAPPVLAVADLTLDPATREVWRAGTPVSLTTREHALLGYLMRTAGRVLTRPMIAEHV